MKKLTDILREVVDQKITYEEVMGMTPTEVVEYVGSWEGFNDIDDAVREMEYLFDSSFPYGFRNIPSTVELFRYLALDDGSVVDEDELGKHYVADDSFVDKAFFQSIGLWYNWSEDAVVYKLTCNTDRDNLDWDDILHARMNFPRENEFAIVDTRLVTVVDKERRLKQDYAE